MLARAITWIADLSIKEEKLNYNDIINLDLTMVRQIMMIAVMTVLSMIIKVNDNQWKINIEIMIILSVLITTIRINIIWMIVKFIIMFVTKCCVALYPF